jgi:hypothetical protein
MKTAHESRRWRESQARCCAKAESRLGQEGSSLRTELHSGGVVSPWPDDDRIREGRLCGVYLQSLFGAIGRLTPARRLPVKGVFHEVRTAPIWTVDRDPAQWDF